MTSIRQTIIIRRDLVQKKAGLASNEADPPAHPRPALQRPRHRARSQTALHRRR